MLIRIVIAVAIVAVAVAVARIVAHRRALDPPTQRRRSTPSQLDRSEFAGPERAWLVVVFSSETCHTCASVIDKAKVLESDEVAVDVVSYQVHRDRHDRYGIDAVPMTLVVDADGVCVADFVGPVGAADLWAAVADARS